jgi:class 3 adenylate cyclase
MWQWRDCQVSFRLRLLLLPIGNSILKHLFDCLTDLLTDTEPRKDHATVMARFARDCLNSINDLTKRLEISLGPDTGDLSMRIGLHSGPVTAGVLRGDKSRFQLFGDTGM